MCIINLLFEEVIIFANFGENNRSNFVGNLGE